MLKTALTVHTVKSVLERDGEKANAELNTKHSQFVWALCNTDGIFLSPISLAENKKKGSTIQELFVITMTDYKKVAHLLRALPAFNRADGEAESGSTRDIWNVHVVVEPFVPPVRKIPLAWARLPWRHRAVRENPELLCVYYLGLEQGTRCVLTLSHNCSPPW